MRNLELEKLDILVGNWTVTMSDASFLEQPGTTEAARRASSGWTTRSWSCEVGA